jgi:hypothetical protein
VPVIHSPNLPKKPQVFYYDLLVHQQPRPGRSAHVAVLSIVPYETLYHSLSTEQTEINRIIADASKGSKFYEVLFGALP